MRWAVTKSSLVAALVRVSRIVKSNPRSVEILQCVSLHTYGDAVYLTATSHLASAKVAVEGAKISEPGHIVVNFDRLKDRLAKSGDAVVLSASEDSLQIVSSQDQRLGLRLADPREFPTIDWVTPDESYALPSSEITELFKSAIAITSSTDSLVPSLMQVRIQEQRMWVSNGMTYQVFPMECNPALESAIPVITLSAINQFVGEAAGDRVWLSQSGRDVVVSVGLDQLQTVPLATAFPDLEPLFTQVSVAASQELTFDKSDLIKALTAAKTSSDLHERVTIEVSGYGPTKAIIRTESEIGDWYESKVPCLWTGDKERTFVFNVSTLINFVRTFKDQKICLVMGDDFRGSLTPAYCKEGDHAGIINQFRI